MHPDISKDTLNKLQPHRNYPDPAMKLDFPLGNGIQLTKPPRKPQPTTATKKDTLESRTLQLATKTTIFSFYGTLAGYHPRISNL